MRFTSFGFIFVFLPGAVWLFRHTGERARLRLWVALALSVLFYSINAFADLPVIGLSIVGNALAARGVMRCPAPWRGRALGVAVAANLAGLAFYKYAGALGLPMVRPDLPLGISYFTFTQIAFLVDVCRGRANLVDGLEYAVFVGWFPHLSAGPLLAPQQMLPQLTAAKAQPADQHDIAVGLLLFTVGLFKKTTLAPLYVSAEGSVFVRIGHGDAVGLVETWLSCLAYFVELYLDFSGYSDMALGVSRMFGIHLPVNFHAPFRSSSIIEFWTRWHITLGRFMRDYVYTPLTRKRQTGRHYAALFVVMLAVAVWHGATVPLLGFGLFHGFLVAANHAGRRWGLIRRQGSAWQGWLGRVVTLLSITFSISLWRAPDWGVAWRTVLGLTGSGGAPAGLFNPSYAAGLLITIAVTWTLPSVIDLLAAELPPWSLPTRVRQFGFAAWRPSWLWVIVTAGLLAVAIANIPDAVGFRYAEF
ncbi:MAG: MBOAT family O-acyltransferase [Azospirillaceae bacterium]|nr:MBOAT family O-acyltransferase [Azospirillaceae bacterium]